MYVDEYNRVENRYAVRCRRIQYDLVYRIVNRLSRLVAGSVGRGVKGAVTEFGIHIQYCTIIYMMQLIYMVYTLICHCALKVRIGIKLKWVYTVLYIRAHLVLLKW
jgi:hypothetical protein